MCWAELQVQVLFLNWVATCSTKAATQRAQASLLGYVLSDASQAVGLVLDPIFSHQKGQAYMARHSARKMLAEQNLNLDNHFMLQFENKSDARDGRPNNYPERLGIQLGPKGLAWQVQDFGPLEVWAHRTGFHATGQGYVGVARYGG